MLLRRKDPIYPGLDLSRLEGAIGLHQAIHIYWTATGFIAQVETDDAKVLHATDVPEASENYQDIVQTLVRLQAEMIEEGLI